MDAEGEGQLDIRGAAGAGDKNQVVMVSGFGKDLVQICAQHFGADDGQVDARQE